MKRRNFIQKGLGAVALGSAAYGMRNSLMAQDISTRTIMSPDDSALTDKELPKINLHGHLAHHHIIKDRIKIWDEWNVQHFSCLCFNDDYGGKPMKVRKYFNNTDFLKIKDEYGDKILGFAGVATTRRRVSSPYDIERYKEQGFTGLKFTYSGYPYDHDIILPLYDKAQELKMPIVFHSGFLGFGDVVQERELGVHVNNMRVNTLDKVVRWFPDLQISAAHLGHPDRTEALEKLTFYKNFHCDFSGGGGSEWWVQRTLKPMLPPSGIDIDMSNPSQNPALGWFKQLCFGTDSPEPDVWVPNSQYIMDTLEIPLETRKLFYYDTAAKMLGW